MRVFEREILDFIRGCVSDAGGECCMAPGTGVARQVDNDAAGCLMGMVACMCIGGLNVLRCGEEGLAVVMVPMDYFSEGGTVEDIVRAGEVSGAGDLVFLYEDRWRGSGPLVRAMLRVRLGGGQRVFARNCTVRRIDAETAAAFLERNHVYGAAKAPFRLGLFRKRSTGRTEAPMDLTPQLVAVALFSEGRMMEDGALSCGPYLSYEWVRYASARDLRVTGGMGRLLEAFVEARRQEGVAGPLEVMTYADLEWYDGRSYVRLGFEDCGYRPPVAFLCTVDGGMRVHEGKIRSDRRFRHLAGETDGMARIFNLGSRKFVRVFQF